MKKKIVKIFDWLTFKLSLSRTNCHCNVVSKCLFVLAMVVGSILVWVNTYNIFFSFLRFGYTTGYSEEEYVNTRVPQIPNLLCENESKNILTIIV